MCNIFLMWPPFTVGIVVKTGRIALSSSGNWNISGGDFLMRTFSFISYHLSFLFLSPVSRQDKKGAAAKIAL